MKTIALKVSLLALLTPLSVYGIGLGQMTVKSALDQPFLAEIELLDISNSAFNTIKASLASPDEFAEIGLDEASVVSQLDFNVSKNKAGQPVILIRSQERITEPYMEVVVDLTWPDGQIYKAYTVLLDPPGYKLASTRIQGGPTRYGRAHSHDQMSNPMPQAENKPEKEQTSYQQSTYGPTVVNENIWQVAQHYKTPELTLPQIVLAIVGANPKAFKKGNLNGLIDGQQLLIPSTQDMQKVPSELATAEAMSHDKAWNDKGEIRHLLTPPYTHLPANTAESKPVAINLGTNLTNSNADINTNKPQVIDSIPSINSSAAVTGFDLTKMELSLTKAALDAIRESNSALTEQLRLLQSQNIKLQKSLSERENEVGVIRQQLVSLQNEKQSLTNQIQANHKSHWLLWLLLLSLGGGAGYWYFRLRPTTIDAEYDSTFIAPELVKPQPENKQSAAVVVTESEKPVTAHETAEEAPIIETPTEDVEIKNSDDLQSITAEEEPAPATKMAAAELSPMEFEPSPIEEKQEMVAKKSVEEAKSKDNSIDFIPTQKTEEVAQVPDASPSQDMPSEPANALKNLKALDTLLALSKTYVEMGDKNAAMEALSEVIEFGSEDQKKQANEFIEQLKNS